MLLKIKEIKEIIYNEEVYDLSLNNETKLFYSTTDITKDPILVHNCDFEPGGRDLILKYLISEFGQESVCNVPTFGLYGPKSALQDMSRGLNKDTTHDSILMRKITKIDGLEDATGVKGQPTLVEFFDKLHKGLLSAPEHKRDKEVLNWIENNQDTIDYAQRIIGQMRQLGVHAGGILVTPGPVYDYIPVTRGSGNLVAAFKEADGSSKDLSELGLLKLDILGLKTLGLLKQCVENIKKDTGVDLTEKINFLDLKDKRLLDSFASGNNYGIFQMDRSKMFTSRIKVDSFEDIVAINAINRPGPLEKFLDKYGYWKKIDKGEIKVTPDELEVIDKERYPFPFMRKVLQETYGCLAEDELIYLPESNKFVAIKDIKNNEIILSRFNINRGNNLLIDNGNKDVFLYKLSTGYELKVTKDHKVYTLESGEIAISEAFEKKYAIALPKKLISKKLNNFTPEKGRILGMMLGDGCLTQASYLFSKADIEIVENFKYLIENNYTDCKVSFNKRDNGVIQCQVSGIVKRKCSFKEEYKSFGIDGLKSEAKFVPQVIFDSDDEVKKSFLSGYFDTDGGLNKTNASIKSKSKQLILDCMVICRQLGYLPTIYFYENIKEYILSLPLCHYKEFSDQILLERKQLNETHSLTNRDFKGVISKGILRDILKENNVSLRSAHKQYGFYGKGNTESKVSQIEYYEIVKKYGSENLKKDIDNFYFVAIETESFLKHSKVYDLNIQEDPWFTAGLGGILVHNCLLYQEQFMFLVCEAGGFDLGEADNFRRGIAWLPDNPKYHTVQKYYDKLEEGMKEKGYMKEDTDFFVQYCRDFAGYSFNKSHSLVYSYIAYQTLYFKVYYPAYFYAAMINMENDVSIFQEIIADVKKNGVEILPHSITKSKYKTTVEYGKAIRLGFNMVKGMGGAVEEELQTLGLANCTSLEEVLQKPFKKINSTMVQNLIDLGCFDEFNVERGKLDTLKEMYQDEKIAFWFTRPKQRLRLETIPPSLEENFNKEECLKIAMKVKDQEEPHIKLINQLIPQIKVRKTSEEAVNKKTAKKQKELIGFSLVNDNPLAKYEAAFNIKGILPLKEYESNPTGDFYFTILKKDIKLTSRNSQYMQLQISDGISEYKVKCWSVLNLNEGEVYYGKFKKDNYGLTLDSKSVFTV